MDIYGTSSQSTTPNNTNVLSNPPVTVPISRPVQRHSMFNLYNSTYSAMELCVSQILHSASLVSLYRCNKKITTAIARSRIQYIPRNMHTVFALLCFVVVIHWLIFPYPSGLLHWHCGNLTIAPVPAKQPWWIWINTSCELIMNDCITTTKQSTTKPCAYFLGYTVMTTAHRVSTVVYSSLQVRFIRT